MTDLPRGFVWLMLAAGGVLVAALISFLMDLTEDQSRAPLTVADVEGIWSASDGGRLTVRADGSAELERVMEPETDCGQSAEQVHFSYTGPATWAFDTWPDESPGIRFDYRGSASGKTCKVYLSVSISDETGSVGFLPHDPEPSYMRGAAHPG
ncbi:hypothetical protein ABZY16_01670 [Streptomyces sp. NPDC006553]|uniref:hypothetical protein n=1 Tax=unclassified Streptomyces TaxID=2593676 RepID=UPI00225BFC2A|nr:hypothetical protein [Streptomyces sp. NBC_00233]MCX5231511.1 hypothetical protein [Streptomyces sp. NBC_00233]